MKNEEMKIREELYSKIKNEYVSFINNLKKCSPEHILNKSYEIVIKEELCILFSPRFEIFNIEQIKSLNKKKAPLQFLYHEWMKTDFGIQSLVNYGVLSILDRLVRDQKYKNITKER